MGLFDFLKGGKTEEKAPPKEAPAKPKEKPHAPERTAESLQAEQMRLLRGTAILNGERLKTLRPERITEDLRRIDKARGLADFELKLAEKESEKKQLEKWKLGLGLLAGMYRAQTRENRPRKSIPAQRKRIRETDSLWRRKTVSLLRRRIETTICRLFSCVQSGFSDTTGTRGM